MKKLIVMLSIAGATMFSAQAAKCYWGFQSAATTTETFSQAANLTDFTAYLVTSYNWSTYGIEGLSSHYAASSAYGTWTTKVYNTDNEKATFLLKNGTLATGLQNLNNSATTSYGVGDSAAFYLVFSDGNKYAAYEAGPALILDDASTAKYNDTGMTTAFKKTFTGTNGFVAAADLQSIPEPTSGLLLLLGVAGLALRRRRV